MEHPWASCHGRRQFHFIFALIAAFGAYGYSQARTKTTPSPDSEERTSDAPPSALAVWLDALARAESGNQQRLVHRDRDGQFYYGCLQFQARTFRVYVMKLHLLPAANRSELMSRIYDCAFQKRLAAAMLRHDPNNWKHWRLTVEKKVGPPPADTESEIPDR